MKKPRVLIVEDEWIISEELKELLLKNDFEVIGQAESAENALELIKQNPPDIALLDINIKGDRDGIELAEEIMKIQQVAIIFLTAFYDDYFIQRAKRVEPAAYIVKPFDERNLIVAIQMAFAKLAKNVSDIESVENEGYLLNDRIFIRDKQRFIRIDIEELTYLAASGSYTDIHTISGKTYTIAQNLSHFENKVSHPLLTRIHRSYLVNINHIQTIEASQLTVNGIDLTISQTYREALYRKLKMI